MRHRHVRVIAVAMLLSSSAAASAQGIARSFDQLRVLVRSGDTVTVRDAQGAETSGRITAISPATSTLEVRGAPRDFREADTREGAQPATSQTAAELSGKVEAGETIFVTDRNGVQTGGRLLRLSPEGLALLVGGQERVLPLNGVGRVEKRDSLWNGMLIGAVPFALVGMAVVGASCSPTCDRDVPVGTLAFGAIGAGIGVLIDFGIHGYSIIDGQPLAPPNARRVPAPVASLDELWLRVRQGDTIDVATIGAPKVTGTFVRVSSTFVTLMVDGKQREIPSNDVRRVTRAGNRYRSGALWGGAILGAMGLLSSAGCDGGGCGNPLFSGMFAGGVGALGGAAIGAAIPKHPVVYESGSSSAVRVVPILHSGRLGAAVSARF